MKILYLDYPAIGGETIKKTFKKLGHEVVCFEFPHDSAEVRNGEELGVRIAEAILQADADLVFSFNFYPVAATAVHACRRKYVSWVYDCPTSLLYSMAVFFPENYIFHFDSHEVEKLRSEGVEHVWYLSLASYVDEYDGMVPDEPARTKYGADIAMIGSLYRDKYHMFKKYEDSFDAYLKGYMDGVITSQEELYGVDLLEPALSDDIMSRILKAVPLPLERGDGFDTPRWIFANYYMGMRVTANERVKYLSALSERYDTAIYTPQPVPELKKVRNMGPVEYYKEAPYAIKCAKINLNITLHCIQRGIPLRVMDILGCGGFLMTNYQADLCEEFVPGEDFVMFDCVADAVEKAGYYLEHEDERDQIARNGYAKVNEMHGFETKVSAMLDEVDSSWKD